MKTEDNMILRVDIVTTVGAKTYAVGDNLNGKTVAKIGVVSLHFQGDPFDHYIGYSKDGEMIFSINCLTPCVVEYL